jgi:hypothetical protein
MQTCPRCTLISPDGATHCDCGFDFSTPLAAEQAEIKKREWDAAWRVPVGLTVLVFGLALSFRAAISGSPVIYWGMLIGGVGVVLSSIKRFARFRDADRAIRDEAAKRPKGRRFRRR